MDGGFVKKNGFIVMEKYDKSLKKYIIDGGKVTKKMINNIMGKINEFHNEGYIHADLHIGNIMIKNNKCRIIDFGTTYSIYEHRDDEQIERNVYDMKGEFEKLFSYTFKQVKKNPRLLDMGIIHYLESKII